MDYENTKSNSVRKAKNNCKNPKTLYLLFNVPLINNQYIFITLQIPDTKRETPTTKTSPINSKKTFPIARLIKHPSAE